MEGAAFILRDDWFLVKGVLDLHGTPPIVRQGTEPPVELSVRPYLPSAYSTLIGDFSIRSMMDVRRHFTVEVYWVALVAVCVADMSELQFWQTYVRTFTCIWVKPKPFQRRFSLSVASWINVVYWHLRNLHWIESRHAVCIINAPFKIFSPVSGLAVWMVMLVCPSHWSAFKYLNNYW